MELALQATVPYFTQKLQTKMNTSQKTSIQESFKKLKAQDFIFPGIIIVFAGITLVVFLAASAFISKNINKIFIPDDTSRTQALNLEQYKLIAKKLGITVLTPVETGVPQVSTPAQSVATTMPVSTSAEKRALNITIKNSTTKKDVASQLAKALESAGYAKATTGDMPTLYATTTVVLNTTKAVFGTELLLVVRKSYPDAVISTTTSTGSADATIIIGTH